MVLLLLQHEWIKAIIQDENIVMPLSVMPHGEYGLSDLYLGIPAVLNGSGIRELVEYHLTNQEHQALLAVCCRFTRGKPEGATTG